MLHQTSRWSKTVDGYAWPVTRPSSSSMTRTPTIILISVPCIRVTGTTLRGRQRGYCLGSFICSPPIVCVLVVRYMNFCVCHMLICFLALTLIFGSMLCFFIDSCLYITLFKCKYFLSCMYLNCTWICAKYTLYIFFLQFNLKTLHFNL